MPGLQDLLLAVLAEDHPLRLAVNSAHMPPLLACTTAHSFPSHAAAGGPPGGGSANAATPQPSGALPLKGMNLTEVSTLAQDIVRV